jgi:hypothetical protein
MRRAGAFYAKEAPRPTQARAEEAQGAQEAPHEEVTAGAPRFTVDAALAGASSRAALLRLLEAGWRKGLSSRLIHYDPGAAEVLSLARFRYHYLPGRQSRPGSWCPPGPEDTLSRPHAPCPFDGAEFVARRELARLERAGRAYHLVANRYPVTPLHFLAVRSAAAPPELLPQRLHGPEEVEDLLLTIAAIGPPYRAYFNSNRGANGSQSGSSVNHWHFQLFPHPRGRSSFDEEEIVARREAGEEPPPVASVFEAPSWPARHAILEAGGAERFAALTAALWMRLEAIHSLDAAYNLEVSLLPDGRLRAILFLRSPPPRDIAVPGLGSLSPNFGGWELTGDIVIPDGAMLRWIEAHPQAAEELTADRLREATRALPGAVRGD